MVQGQLLLGVNYNMYQENLIPWSSFTPILIAKLESEIKTCVDKYE
jgi:hypothetical protein